MTRYDLRSEGWGKWEKTITRMRDRVWPSPRIWYSELVVLVQEKVIWKQRGGLRGTPHRLPSPAVDREERRTAWEGCRGGKILKDSQVFIRIETWRTCSENVGMNCSEDANEWLSSQGQRRLREEGCGQNMSSQRHVEIRARAARRSWWGRADPTLVLVCTADPGGQGGRSIWPESVQGPFWTPVTACLPRSEHLVISWLQSLSPVTLEPKKIKSVTAANFSPSTSHEAMGHFLLGRKAMANRDSIKMQRHHFACKGPNSQSYGFFQ